MTIGALLGDESHGQTAWFGPKPTFGSGFRRFASLVPPDGRVAYLPEGADLAAALAGNTTVGPVQALVLPIGPQGRTRLTAAAIAAIHAFVRQGGGLLVLGTYTGDWHHEANLNELIETYGIVFQRDLILPAAAQPTDGFIQGGEASPESRCAVQALTCATVPADRTPLVAETQDAPVAVLSSCSLYLDETLAAPVCQVQAEATLWEPEPLGVGIHIRRYVLRARGPAVVLAAARQARVIVAGGWKFLLDAFLDRPDLANRRLAANILAWLLAPPAASAPAAATAAVSPLAPSRQDEIQAIADRLHRRRALLAALQKELVLATGAEAAALRVRVTEVEKDIRADEAELDRLHGE